MLSQKAGQAMITLNSHACFLGGERLKSGLSAVNYIAG
jgi:hypothetical protein